MIILVVIIGLGVTSVYFYKKSKNPVLNQEQATIIETNALVKEIGKLMLLPEGETPTVAVVSDEATVRKTNEFFVHAKNGYKILIYTNAKKAILYDPIEKKIINAGPISIGSASPTSPIETE